MSVVPSASRRLLIEVAPALGLESSSRPAGAAWTTAAPPPRRRSAHPWDEAHLAVANPASVGLEATAAPLYAEPDFVQRFPTRGPGDLPPGLEGFGAGPCEATGMSADWPPAAALPFAWHLGDDFSGLAAARALVGAPAGRKVRIAILDTGYDPDHVTKPRFLNEELQRNFVDGDPSDATDPARHFPTNQPGHGTATMALLAGNRVRPPDSDFDDDLGGAPNADVVPVRIADSVVHFYTSAIANGLDYAVAIGADVVSMSMGGVPARSWAAAVNRAYEAGVAIFAAAGNRFGPSPPLSTVYPARFNRVVAVCGATADKTPYYKSGWHRLMQGCFGPAAKMATALTAFTPNVPWALMGCQALVSLDGAGTSSATPQAAAAAALWLQRAGVPESAQPWQRVEAVRNALFASADKSPDDETHFGQGLLRARLALDEPFRDDLDMTPSDSVSFPWLRMLDVLEATAEPDGRALMYEVEALQIYLQSPKMQQLAGGADPLADDLDAVTRKKLVGALRDSPLASQALRDRMTEMYGRL